MRKAIIIYILTFVLAAASIMYELVIADAIAGLAARTVAWYSITIGLYLLTMGVGAFYSSRLTRNRTLLNSLFYTEIALMLCGGLSVIVLHFAHMLHIYFMAQALTLIGMAIFPILAVSVISVVGFLTGIELPLLIELANKTLKKDVANRVLAADYMGSLAGALLVPLVLIPLFSEVHAAFITALLNLAGALGLLIVFIGLESAKKGLIAGLITSIAIIGIMKADSIEHYFIQKYYFYFEAYTSFTEYVTPSVELPVVRVRSPYQYIDLFTAPDYEYRLLLNSVFSSKFEADPSYPLGYHLFINGDFQVLSNTDDIYHEWFAHFAIVALGTVPKNVLVLGGGDGLLLKELLKYRDIERITLVELDPEMLALARDYPILKYMNGGSLENPRVHIVVGDAYTFVKNSTSTYDAIYADLPYAQDYNLARLYSREFYSFVRKLLGEDGFLVFDAPGADLYANRETGEIAYIGPTWPIHYHTLRAAGFDAIYPYGSILERYNKQAFDALDALDRPVGDTEGNLYQADARTLEELEHEAIREAIAKYADTSNQPFILAKPEGSIEATYHEQDVTLHVLNEDRFNLSVAMPYPMPDGIDRSYVNSIMRPVLSPGSAWQLRRPY